MSRPWPISQVQALEQQVQQLQRLLGKKTSECEILREAVEVGRAKKFAIALAMVAGGRHRVGAVCRVLGVARSNVIERRSRGSMWRDGRGRRPVEDPGLIGQLRDLAAQRPTYGYRRLWALLRRLRAARGQDPINAKRVYRLAKAHQLLLQRHTDAPSLGLAHAGPSR